jgi:hypothetical protein
MPDVIEVRYVRDYTVWIKFDDGTQGDVDISRSFKGPVFAIVSTSGRFA